MLASGPLWRTAVHRGASVGGKPCRLRRALSVLSKQSCSDIAFNLPGAGKVSFIETVLMADNNYWRLWWFERRDNNFV